MASKTKYGIDWPTDYPDEMIELVLAKKHKEFAKAGMSVKEPWEHLLRACRMLFTPREFTISPWTTEHAVDFTSSDFCITWGAGATSKSNDYGLFVLLDWVVDPNDTIVLVGSTTKEALRKRSWESTSRYFNLLKKHAKIDFPGRAKSSGYAILNSLDADDEAQEEKAGIFGVALDESGKLQGAHLPYVRILVDELATLATEGARQAIEVALSNLRKGAISFKFFGLANPTSRMDLSGFYAEPLGGWNTVSIDNIEWSTRFGKVRHHDGLKSPAITEPDGATKYPFLVNAESIKADRDTLGEDHPTFYTMVRGWPSSQGNAAVVMTEADLVSGKAMNRDIDGVDISRLAGTSNPFFKIITIGALDSAFSQGGDSAILQACQIIHHNGLAYLCFDDPTRIPISETSERTITYQLVDFTRRWIHERGITVDLLAADDSGTQTVCDVITEEIGPGVFRVNYSNAASDLPISGTAPTEAKKKFKDRATEAWAVMAEFVKAGQVRGLTAETARQLVGRQYATARNGVVVEPRRLEKKADFKARTKLGSPDEADAAAMTALLARHRLGMVPGTGKYPVSFHRAEIEKPRITLRSASSLTAGASDSFARLRGRYGTT